MELFTSTFLKLSQRFQQAGEQFVQLRTRVLAADEQEELPRAEFTGVINEFAEILSATCGYQDQLLYFFFRDELDWKTFLTDPEAETKDPFFKYEKTNLTLGEAHSLHLLHQYSWLQTLKKLGQMDPEKGSIVFLLPPKSELLEIDQPDYLPECILMEANMYKGQPLFYCWNVLLPRDHAMTLDAGEHIINLYRHIEEHFDHPPDMSLRDYLTKMKQSMEERKKDGRFENVSTFGGARDKKEGHIYFLYWTEFHVFMCTLDINRYQDTLEQRIRKNNLIPFNTLFCEPVQFRKFRLEFEDEGIAFEELEEEILSK